MILPDRRLCAFVFPLFFCLMISLACTDKRGSPVGISLIGDDIVGEPVDTLLYAVQDTSFQEEINTSSAPVLYVGRSGETRVRTLLRFDGLPQADSILHAVVRLSRSSEFTQSTFDVIAYPVTTEWHVLNVTWTTASGDSAGDPVPWLQEGGDFDFDEMGRFTFGGGEEDTLFEMELDTDVVKSWIEDNDQNNGIILISSGEESDLHLASMVSRQSTEGLGEPTIEIEYIPEDNPDTTLTVEKLVSNDLFIYEYQGAEVPEVLLLGAVPSFRTMLRFDLSGFDTTWTVIRADLNVHVADSTFILEDLTMEAFAVLSTWEGSDSEIDDAVLGVATVSRGDSALALNMTGMVQLWALGDFENHGLMLEMGRLESILGHVELYGPDSPVQEKRPSMKVFYHIPDDPPFSLDILDNKKETVLK